MQVDAERTTLREEDLPALFQSADKNSLKAQKQFLRRTGAGLLMLVIAAGVGMFTWRVAGTGTADLAGVAAAVAFFIAFLLQFYLHRDRPEELWYKGRAVAESAKTLAWRYGVGGEPFGADKGTRKVDEVFSQRLYEIRKGLGAASVGLPPEGRTQITQGMRELRKRSLEERKEAYRTGRIQDQLDWYCRKATWNKERAERWSLALMSVEILGFTAAILKAVGIVNIYYLGFAATVVAAGATWLQTKQHSTLSQAYSDAAHDLALISDRIPAQTEEDEWARFVGESEEAISREHKSWRAFRTTNSKL